MNHKQVEIIKRYHAETNTQELLAIWKENDREDYTEDAFEAIKQLLQERGVSVPTQNEFVPKEDRQAVTLVKSAEDPFCLGLANKVIKYEVKGTSKGLGLNSVSVTHLYVGSLGLCVTVISEYSKQENIFADWATIRELKNDLQANNSFLMNMGKGVDDLCFKIKILNDDATQLSDVFEKLPDTAACGKCPKCAGLVRKGVCESCGKELKDSLRQRGFRFILVGLSMTVIGLLLCIFVFYWFESVNSPILVIWYGPPLAGLLLFLRGCYEVLWRKKI